MPADQFLTVDLHGVWMSGGRLGVRCLNCDHRAVLDSQEVTIIRKANMTPLRILKLRCQKCGVIGAGKNFWEMCTPFGRAEGDQFLMGHDIGRKVVL